MDLNLTIRYLDDLAGLGVTIPKRCLDARGIYEAALAAASSHPSDSLRLALDAGALTPENVGDRVREAAISLTAKQNAHQIVRDLQNTLNKAIREALCEHATQIHGELDAVFKPAADGVARAAQHFGPDTTADEVLAMPTAAAAQWRTLASHMHTLDVVSAGYRSFLVDVMRTPPENKAALFITDGSKLDLAAELYRVRGSWHAMAAAGISLRLNTPEQAAAVVAEAQEIQARATAAEREAHLKAHRHKHRLELGAIQ